MKRHRTGVAVALTVLAAGALASACTVTPTAASSNGATISTSSLNRQLKTLETTVAGSCLLQLDDANLSAFSGQGQGGSGTYTMTFANAVLNNQVGDLLASQFARSKGITVSASDLISARSDLESTLDGEISQAVSNAQSEGTASSCELSTGSTITGAELVGALPASVARAQIANQAIDEKLLARHADITAAAVAAFYKANTAQFTQACVSVIATDTQAHAQTLVAQINAGASFASVAKANSTDTQTAANGGSLGCNFTLSQVQQDLQASSITVGQPLAPVEDSSSGQWIIYEVTSATVEPLSAAEAVIDKELLQTTTNVERVSHEIVAFARTSDVSVNPLYGHWHGLTIVPPVAPPSEYLLAGVSGTPTSSGSLKTSSGSSTSSSSGS